MLVAATAFAQGETVQDNVANNNQEVIQQEVIQKLVRQVNQLEEKVAALEEKKGKAPATAAAESGSPNVASPDPTPEQIEQLQESHYLRGIRWGGFGEVNDKVLDQRMPELESLGFVPGSAGNFYTGDFDLFLTSKITGKASVLAEIVIGEGDAQSFRR